MSLNADITPIIFGCAGPALDADEKKFFRDANPAGFILFQKNCIDPEQVKKLTAELRDCVGWAAPILIDQEGGRVQRLKPPHWPDFPPARRFGDLYRQNKKQGLDAVATNNSGLALVQRPLGINVNCVPVLDVVPVENKAMAIDDRSYGADPNLVSALGVAACRAAIDAGMTPVMKHMPGHGRAIVDSHHDLPRVDADLAALTANDFLPFATASKAIDNAKLWGMTAHVIYTAIDPDLPATLSFTLIDDIIRKQIGFDGLLVSDDLFMEALAPYGDVPERARKSLEAGCDIALHCHGDVAAREKAVKALPAMRADSRKRLAAWQKTC